MKIAAWKCDLCGAIESRGDALLLPKPNSFTAKVTHGMGDEWNFPEICDRCSAILVATIDEEVKNLKGGQDGI